MSSDEQNIRNNVSEVYSIYSSFIIDNMIEVCKTESDIAYYLSQLNYKLHICASLKIQEEAQNAKTTR